MAEIETTHIRDPNEYDVKIPAKETDKTVGDKIVVALRKLAKRYERAS